MRQSTHSMDEGERIVYFHGTPGSPDELLLFPASGLTGCNGLWVLPRHDHHNGLSSDQYFDALASEIAAHFPNGPIRLVGFSLGAFIAMNVVSRLDNRIISLDLISPAGPLELGDFLGQMAGGPVFRMARYSRLLFSIMVSLQSCLARIAPGSLFHVLFADVAGHDRAMTAQPTFKSAMVQMLQQSIGRNPAAYRREVTSYVEDWASILPLISPPVTLWYGDDDNWTPPSMVEALGKALPNVVAQHRLAGHSHYSTLGYFLDRGLNSASNGS